VAYQARFERTEVLSDVDRAIELGEHAVAATPTDHPDRVTRLANLSTGYQRRFKRTRVLTDLDRAIETG
jgi:hypothetical protein